MQSPQKARSRILLAWVLALVFAVFTAQAAEPLVYKGPRKEKEIRLPEQEKTKKLLKQELFQRKQAGYVYDPTGKPDPFRSFIAKQEAFEKRRRHRKPKTYLETLELSQLDLIAVIVGPKGNWAMVRDSKGVGHVIKKGTAIGTNGGVVWKIQEDRVIIREKHVDFRGKETIKDVVKKLHASK
ncbi:MAG: hypothetical protein DRG63_01610 [Deltaproteobacteria bacterium]|nr:MAG: hypothetical protein DRG63_01610 [Deltaproteobacteria bacterium]